jgi:DNA polymerase-3 subunit epsilon
MLVLERPLAFFDLETTGVRIGRDRIVQIAVVRLMLDGSREPLEALSDLGPIPKEATDVHGISDADVALLEAGGHRPEIAGHLAGCDLSGFNLIRFDVPFLAEELLRVGVAWDTSAVRIVDVQRIYHKMERRDLSAAVAFYLDRSHDTAHSASGDVEATLDVLLAQLGLPELPTTVNDLGSFAGTASEAPMRAAN